MDTDNDTILEPSKTRDENGSSSGPFWALPPQSEILAATPDQRAILYAETLARIAAAGETVDPGWLRSAVVGAAATAADLHIKHTPRLLKEAAEIAAEVKAGRAKLPKRGADWYYFWKRRAKEAAAASTKTEPTPPTGDAAVEVPLEKVSNPESAEIVAGVETLALVVPEANESEIVLAQLERVRGLLAEVATVPQAKEAVAAAKMIEIYARETKASAAILGLAFRVRSLAKRRLGETIVKMQEAGELEGPGGDRKSKSTPTILKLKDLDLSRDESSRAKAFASVSEPEFERILDEAGAGELSDAALLRRIRAAKAKTVPSSNSKTPKTPSTATVPGQSAGAVTLKTHVTRVADALDKLLAGWKLTDLAPLKEAARGNERLAGGLERLERNLDRAVKTLRGYRSIAS